MREGKHQHLGHRGLIKLIVEYALNKIRIRFLWSKSMDMNREAFNDTQTLTLCGTLASSAGGRDGNEEEEEVEVEKKKEELE